LATGVLAAQESGEFKHLATFRGLGLLVASTVGRGPAEDGERWYGSYLYLDNTIEVIAVAPATGSVDVFPNPAKTESGARCITAGPDGNIYLGTLPSAHFLKVDTRAGKLIDLGRPSSTEQYIWDVAFGPDRKLYGATYPRSKLVRYDPATGKLEDLGRMDDVEQYAHYVAGSDDGFMYVGIGTSRQNIVAYHIASGEHRAILPAEYQTVGQAIVQRGIDGRVYGRAGSHAFRLEGWTATPVAGTPAPAPTDRLRDGTSIRADGPTLHLTAPSGKSTDRTFRYAGNEVPIFRVGLGPDGRVYASTVLPIHFLRLDEKHHAFDDLGSLGEGEIYSFAVQGNRLLAAGYASVAPLLSFDPSRPFHAGANPSLVNYEGSDSAWRPLALINGPGGRVYAGAVAGYGKLGGPLTMWDTATNRVEQNQQIITDQSLSTLAAWKNFIIAGTTVEGGGGSHPTQKEAHLFIWDPSTHEVVFDAVPLPGVSMLNDFVLAPDGLLYGVGGRSFFSFDPDTRTVKTRQPLPVQSTIYNAAGVGPDGRIWGLADTGIFAIDPAVGQATLAAKTPQTITAGFALHRDAIYFVHGPELYRYRLPRKPRRLLR